jgi:hypothetical protein
MREAGTVMNRWGKAGVRLTEQEVAHRDRQAVGRRNLANLRRQEHDRAAYRLWRAGELKPYLITLALDAQGLYGPEVDKECGAAEPDVDLWEAGKLYPTWEQLVLLAELTGKTPRFLCGNHVPLRVDQTSMRFHGHTDEHDPPRVWSFTAEAVATTVAGAPAALPGDES